jgi:predicted dehydrogenase
MKALFRCDNVYGDFRPMLKDSKVDAIAFYTYGPDHAGHCIEAMKAGKDAMTVIPAAVTLEECRQLIETVKATGRVFMYGETGCFHPAVMAARRLYLDGRFGQVYRTHGNYIHNAYAGPFDAIRKSLMRDGERTWRWGFPQGWYSGHATGPIVHVTRDRFAEVSAIGALYPYEPLKENRYGNPFANTSFFFRTALGKPATADVHWMTASPGHEGIQIHGTELSLFEEAETLPARAFAPDFIDSQFHDQRRSRLDLSAYLQVLPPSLRETQGHGGSHAHIIHEFVSACLQRRRPSVDEYQAAAIAACGIVGFQSATRGGELLKIPDFGPLG